MSSSPMHLSDPQHVEKPEREGLAIVPVLVVVGVLALAGLAAYSVLKPSAVATASIEKVNAVEMPPGDRVVVEIELAMTNTTDKPLKYHSTEIKLATANQEFRDEPASSGEVPRIRQSYPALKVSDEAPLRQDTMVNPGATVKGVVIVAFPVKKADFDARKSLEAGVFFYDQSPVRTKK